MSSFYLFYRVFDLLLIYFLYYTLFALKKEWATDAFASAARIVCVLFCAIHIYVIQSI